MNCLIVEDETFAADHLTYLLATYHPDIKVIGRTDSVSSTVEWLKQYTVELIFMDVHLNDGLSFSVFEQLHITTPIIFCTAYDSFAIQAFSVNSISYLLKPIDIDELNKSIKKLYSLQQLNPTVNTEYSALIPQENSYQQRFLINHGNQLVTVLANQIAYLFTRNKTVIIVTKENQQYSFDATLDQLEKKLNPKHFFRINRQFIIQLDSILKMENETRGRVKIETVPSCKDEMIVSIDRSGEFKKWLKG
jgi:DNA-binding LytR/AlgR family response regulator